MKLCILQILDHGFPNILMNSGRRQVGVNPNLFNEEAPFSLVLATKIHGERRQ